jgi:hypothetical protein
MITLQDMITWAAKQGACDGALKAIAAFGSWDDILKSAPCADKSSWCAWLCYRLPALTTIRAERDAKLATIRAEYDAKLAPIRAEYDAKLAPIRAERDAKAAPIWAEYDAKLATIWAEYDAKLATIRAELAQAVYDYVNSEAAKLP